MKVIIAGNVTHLIKVTRIKPNLWGVRCFTNGILNQEIQVKCKADVGVASAEMLTLEDKCGNHSEQATSSRERFNKGPKWRAYQRTPKYISV